MTVIVFEGTCPQGSPGVMAMYADESTPVSTTTVTVSCALHAMEGDHTTVLQQVLAVVTCEWFAACTRVATHLEPHPVLGHVPACDPCPNVGR